MAWSVVRLELARNPTFPQGSAARAYLFRVPLDSTGFVDCAEFSRSPGLAVVRRYWPNEPDRDGHLVKREEGWSIALAPRAKGGFETLCQITSFPISLGGQVMIAEAGREALPFRVVRCD